MTETKIPVSSSVKIAPHGGDIVRASQQYNIAIDQWIDLSTGINPQAYPAQVELSSLQRLPYLLPEFLTASANYYGSESFIPVTGTQAVIQVLPDVLPALPVLLPQTGYQEHLWCWQRSGASLDYYPALDQEIAAQSIEEKLQKNSQQHLVIINPNNPTGILFSVEQLLSWAGRLSSNAYLIVDEAFIDVIPNHSLLEETLPDNIIVLRSFGKFFGLAGVRLGYCFAVSSLLEKIQNHLGLWQVNGPAQSIATTALNDRSWQQQALENLSYNSQWMEEHSQPLMGELSTRVFHTPLFSAWYLPYSLAIELHHYFAQAGILLRFIPLSEVVSNDGENALLRIGLVDSYNPLIVRRVSECFESACHHFLSQSSLTR